MTSTQNTYSIREENGLYGIHFDEFFTITTTTGERLEVVSAKFDTGLVGIHARRERKNGNGFTTQAYIYCFRINEINSIGFPTDFVTVAEKCNAEWLAA